MIVTLSRLFIIVILRRIMRKASTFSPGHITGFFEMCDTPEDPLYKGSRGAGFSLSIGVRTDLTVEESKTATQAIYFGDKLVSDAIVSEKTIALFFRKAGIGGNFDFQIRHTISVPFGAGFGSSGAGALSLAIALNNALDARLTENEVAGIAHVAEIEAKTGLGTVVAEAVGGVEIRTTAGGPGISVIEQVPVEGEHKILTLTFGPLSTKKYLESKSIRESINKFGGTLVNRLAKNPSIPYFLELSREFAENTGLLPPDLIDILSALDRYKIQASMPMFGHGIFTIIPAERLPETLEILRQVRRDGTLIVSDIYPKGAHSIDEAFGAA
jgi:pantoate kinase